MKSSQLPAYLSHSEQKHNHPQDIRDFTFSSTSQHHNPEKATDQLPQPSPTSSKIEPQELFKSDSSPPEEISQQDTKELSQEQPISSPEKEQIQADEASPSHTDEVQKHPEPQNEESQPRGYEQLTMKLQTALNKIASTSKSPKKSASQTNTIWRRQEQMALRKKKDLQRKREESEQMKKRQVRAKPTINKHSQRIVKEVGHEPIYNRYEKVLEAKKKKEKEIQELKKKQKEDEETVFMEELNRHMRKPETVRNYDAYYDQMVKWKDQTAKQNRQKLQIKQTKELEGVTFKPQLNSKSKKMVASQNRLPIDQRGLIKDRSKNENSFRPNTSHRMGK